MPKVVAFGRVGGRASYQYGPKSFDKDWGGVFTALKIMDLLEKISPSAEDILANVISEPPSPDGVPERAQQVKCDMLLENLEVLALDVEHLAVTAETIHWFSGNTLSQQLFRFETTAGVRPSLLVAKGLIEMGLNTWGYLNQLVLPLSQFTEKSRDGSASHRCMSVFFTI